jgi:iron complex transport system permease protein
MANSRQKKLDKMEVLEKRTEKPKPHFKFQMDRTPSRFVIEAKRLILGYDTPLTNPVDLQLERGKKVALRGVNGLGKTTLLKTLLGMIKPISGNIELGEFVTPGYFEQESTKGNDNTAIEEIWQEYPGMTEFEVRAALAACGLMMQTAFHNPLAGPSVFGINSGASLGVALVMLLFGGSLTAGSFSLTGFMAVLAAAFTGAMAVMALILLFSTMVRNNVMLLIIGIMIGYLAGSAISLLNFFSTEQGVQSYMIWGLGNFGGVSMGQLPLFSITVIAGLLGAMALSKALNALLLGEQYAENLGFNVQHVRNSLLLVTGLLTAVTTAYCGPVVFIGMAVPHVARMLLSTDNHHHLMPATILTGAAVALLCNVICMSPGAQGVIPLNAVTPVMGAPVIIYVILKQKRNF